jgi:hypothetical protein
VPARYPEGGRRREDEPPGKECAFARIPEDDEHQGDEDETPAMLSIAVRLPTTCPLRPIGRSAPGTHGHFTAAWHTGSHT